MTNGAQQQPAGYTGLATQWASVVDHALEVWTTSASSCWQSKGLGAPADFAPLTAWNNYVNELAQLFTGWTSLYRLGGPPGQAAATASNIRGVLLGMTQSSGASQAPTLLTSQPITIPNVPANTTVVLVGALTNGAAEIIPIANCTVATNPPLPSPTPTATVTVTVTANVGSLGQVTPGPYFGRLVTNPPPSSSPLASYPVTINVPPGP